MLLATKVNPPLGVQTAKARTVPWCACVCVRTQCRMWVMSAMATGAPATTTATRQTLHGAASLLSAATASVAQSGIAAGTSWPGGAAAVVVELVAVDVAIGFGL